MDENKNVISEFAIASLAIAAISFISLAGMEKAILAIIFGALALKKMEKSDNLMGLKFARAGIILGFISVLVTIHLIIKIYPKVRQIMNQIQSEQAPLRENAHPDGRQRSEIIPGAKLF